MAIFLNPDNANFNEAVHSKIYVDKTGLIEYTNSVLSTTAKFICNSRPRRFGKSMTADMLCAYPRSESVLYPTDLKNREFCL